MYKIFLLGLVAMLSLSVFQYSNAETVNLDPLVLKQPEDFTETIDSDYFNYQFYKNKILAVDDSGTSLTITCTIEGISPNRSSSSYYIWHLTPGDHTIYCEVEDRTGNSTPVTWNATIIRDVLAPSWFKTVASWYGNNTIDQEMYLKIIKYMHTANILEFDIEETENDPTISPNFQYNTKRWASGAIDNSVYKNLLEDMADSGVFINVNI